MKSISPGALLSPESQGAILFKETCSQCHALPNPKLRTSSEWPKVVERMREHMQVMGKNIISEREKKDIVDYIMAIARQ